MTKILADGRWRGMHGIGRFAHEVLSRLSNIEILEKGPAPLSLQNLAWLPYYLSQHQSRYHLYFNPGFNPVLFSNMPYVLTIHDLIHLQLPGITGQIKKYYYELLLKPSVKKAYKVLTVSDYSKNEILKWASIPPEKIYVVGNGISDHFTQEGNKFNPDFPYLLHVGNTKPHKNVTRLIEAFSFAKIDPQIKLILTGAKTPELISVIQKYHLESRVVFCGSLSDEMLANYYRGALGFVLPSLQEGFGIPVIEAMASGIPTLVSNTTSLPEISGDASILVEPTQIDSITHGIEELCNNQTLRNSLTQKGLIRANLFSWDKTAEKVQSSISL